MLADLPVEVLLDNVLPVLALPDVLRLGCTSRFFAELTNDDTFWKRKLQLDFNFSGHGTARTSGWKFIYRGLSNPRAFVWGENTQGRLGLDKEKFRGTSVPYPVQIRIPGKRIVNLVPGGMSFHALDSEGTVYVWGTLDGTDYTLASDGFSQPGKQAATPHRLLLPDRIRQIACGRLHTLMLSARGTVYTFCAWGRPFVLRSPQLAPGTPGAPAHDAIAQVAAGWGFCAARTSEGAVLVWWPGAGALKEAYDAAVRDMDERVRQGEDALKALPTGGTRDIPCHVFELAVEPVVLPELPYDLPELTHTGESDYTRRADVATRIIEIAGADNALIALTNRGHVLKYDHLTDEVAYTQGRWTYLPRFCDAAAVRELAAFSQPEGHEEYIKPPPSVHITHISAHFLNFVAYSTGASSLVLMGSLEDIADAGPQVLPDLQYRGVIAVVLGDYHKGALTEAGELLTWGAYSKGALGLGDPAELPVGAPGGLQTARQRDAARHGGPRATPQDVARPAPVRFDWGTKPRARFCFLAAAAGWHMGALAIDLDPEAPDEDDEDAHVAMPGAFEPRTPTSDRGTLVPHPFPAPPEAGATPVPEQGPGDIPVIPFLGGRGRGMMHPFRIGLAGARGRGSGPGRGGAPPPPAQ